MDVSLTEMQKMLRASSRDFLKANCSGKTVREMAKDDRGYTPELWKQMGEMGWTGLIIPEKYGGAGCGLLDLIILLEEMGRVCLPGPFFSTAVLGGLLIMEAGSEAQKDELLPKIAGGKSLFTLALSEASGSISADGIQTTSTQVGDEFLIQGTKLFVTDAHVSDYIICAARTRASEVPEDGITLFILDSHTPGLICNLLKTIAGDKQCEVILEGVRVPTLNILGEIHGGWPVLEKILDKATVARCAEMTGGARQILEMTLDYAKQRKAFGRPIGSFQSIQHCCANMIVKIDGMSLMVYNAAWRLDAGLPATREIAMTKVLANEAFREITAQCIQIHGAIGFTEDHDAHLYYKRAKAWEISLGSTNYHLDRISKSKPLNNSVFKATSKVK
jgi:alkylation response protein AidB-like acyl-CoA dehydrogenase